MTSPLISIVTPTFNRATLLADTIESVLTQTYTNWEMVIADDGSTDETRQLIASVSDPRINFHCFDHSANYAIARNRGLRLCSGSHIAFLDSDDLWPPNKLTDAAKILTSHHPSQFILSNVRLFGDNVVQSPAFESRYDVFLFDDLIHERNIVFYPSTLVFRRDILAALGQLDESMPTGADHDFILRMSSQFRGAFLGDRLAFIRKHASNTSISNFESIYLDSISHVHKFYKNGLISNRSYRTLTSGYYYKLGLILMRNDLNDPLRYFTESIRLDPFSLKPWFRYVQSVLKK
jgi:glycosyltransferase involved in cell wall biosynthesis